MKLGISMLLAVLAILKPNGFGALAFVISGSSYPSNRVFETRLFDTPEQLASEGDWAAYLDEDTTGVVYYFNSRTGASQWEAPTNTFPEVTLSPSRKRKADAKKAEYYKNMRQQLQEEEKEEKPGFFSRFIKSDEESGGKSKASAVVEPSPAPASASKNEARAAEAVKKAEQAKPGATINLFGMEFGLPSEETQESIFPDPIPAPAPAAKEERAAEAMKRAEKARPGASINLFGIEFGLPSMLGEEVPTTTETKEDAVPLSVPARSRAQSPARTSEKEKRAAEAVKMVEQAKPGATINLFGMEIGFPSMLGEQKATSSANQAQEKIKTKNEAVEQAETDILQPQAKQPAVEEKIIVEEKPTPIKIDIGSCVLPHPSKVMWGGEDAIFTKGNTFGVFDGVSGADKTDGLPLYSKLLARQMTQLVGPGNNLSIKDMQAQLTVAAEKCDASATGASTAIMATITDDGYLRAINLGDSVCIVIRGEKVVAKTKEIVHYFDCPYQLSDISPDRPRDARKLDFELTRGDIVLMGSDGIFDNLDQDEIIAIANSADQSNKIAKLVADRSRKVSLDSSAETPYSRQAQRNGDPDFKDGLGGKVDDISCVVARYV